MTAGIFHFTIEQGTDFVLPIAYTDADGAPIDLTGCAAALMIRRAQDDAAPLVSLSSPGNGIVINGPAGTLLVTIDSSVTATLASGTAVYDLKLTDGLGNPTRLIEGNVTISPAVTR
ncbi:hypothetical protein GobsT_50710 [Gemmata obscuriglobus]|uniref:Uncharacterized protein n=1 Tax=Gemmata obscuriglobus TaxID=114 RepID=A0A2Z3GZV6_9BACT|nr:hypothetical protein [Gemmata obscuriglobus]AWM37027.1 hypothetical protein C1280_08340 [Gemmata obscuriglobus]QEG30267.1 hypothetical protein GobsT_50710 [Gemmata obscuriglobus]VTS09591.1 Uncharacterized protein OS=Delftia tsuruhatensis GN=GY14_22235 PE=4 SV=1 [Gemmata obscuriglobus UQM 2246]